MGRRAILSDGESRDPYQGGQWYNECQRSKRDETCHGQIVTGLGLGRERMLWGGGFPQASERGYPGGGAPRADTQPCGAILPWPESWILSAPPFCVRLRITTHLTREETSCTCPRPW